MQTWYSSAPRPRRSLHRFTRPLLPAVLIFIGGCASIPEPLRGDYASFPPATTNDQAIGSHVRWGGVLIATNPESDTTCFEILGKSLDRRQRPVDYDETEGRFIACQNGFQDPEIYQQGREVTVIGRIDNIEPRPIGSYEYRYPIVAADTVYLWPERPDYDYYPYGYPYYRPYYWPYYGYGYFGHGHFGHGHHGGIGIGVHGGRHR